MAEADDRPVMPPDAAALARRVAALEKVVEMERRLRRLQEQSRAGPPPAPVAPASNAAVTVTPAAAQAGPAAVALPFSDPASPASTQPPGAPVRPPPAGTAPAASAAPPTGAPGTRVLVPPSAASSPPGGAAAFADDERTMLVHAPVRGPEALAEARRQGHAIPPAHGDDDERTVLHRPAAPAGAASAPGAHDELTVLHRPAADATSQGSTQHGSASHSIARSAPPQPIGQPMPAEVLALPAGSFLLEYRIDEVLGQGGFGITYLAVDTQLNTKVAIKEYLPAEVAQRISDRSVAPRWADDVALYQRGLDSFLVEARTLATFRHPNIVRVARFFEANRTAYMVLEYERGRSLRAWWKKRGNLPEAELLSLLEPLLDGLGVVHAAGFLHRDIKPDNVYVRKDDGSLVLLDFGSARATVGPAGVLDQVVTPGYAPPEQYGSGTQGPWTDIYALGAMLYWMVTGAKPPASPARADGSAVMVPAAEAGKERFSANFLQAIDWALQLEPDARPQSLQDWSQALFANHTSRLSLQDALFANDAEGRSLGSEGLRMLRGSQKMITNRGRRLLRALAHPGSWPMVVKMTLAMVIAALAPMLITAYYNLNGSVAAVSGAELGNLERLAQSTAGRIGQVISDNQSLANYLAVDSDVSAFLQQRDPLHEQAVQTKLGALTASNPDVNVTFVMDMDGKALLASNPATVGGNFAFREYFKQAAQGRPYRTGILVSSTTGKPGVYYANPVWGLDRKVLGVVVVQIKASSFVAALDAVSAGSARSAFMIDGDGVLVLLPDPKHLYWSLTPLSEAKQKQIAAERRYARAHIESVNMPEVARAMVGAQKLGHISYFSRLHGQDEHAGFAPVPANDWVVGVTEPRASFEAPLRELFQNVRRSVGLVGLAFLTFAVLFARSIVRPIRRLTDAADALKQGDYDRARIKVTNNDEIGRLARTFNVLIDVLRQRERERRTGSGGRRSGRRKDDQPPPA